MVFHVKAEILISFLLLWARVVVILRRLLADYVSTARLFFLIQPIKSLISDVVVVDRILNSLLLSNWNAVGLTLRHMTRDLPEIHV